MDKKVVYALLAVAVAVAAGLSLLLLKQAAPPGSVQQPQPSCQPTSLVYVYLDEAQKNLGDTITSNFKVVLQQYGINIVNVPVCYLPASSLPEKLRVYPALLLKGNISALEQLVVGEVGGYKVLNPGVSAYMASSAGASPVFTYQSEAIIVNSTAPFTGIRAGEDDMRRILSQLSLSNVSRITYVTPSSVSFTLTRLPAIVFKSDYNLSKGYAFIKPLGNGYYTFREDVSGRVLEYFGVQVYEIRTPPPSYLAREGVPVGSSSLTLYILEDYHCPFCAKLMASLGDTFTRLAKSGSLKVVLVDLIVHPEVAEMHALAKCVYNKTGDGYLYFNLSRKLYDKLNQGVSTTLEDLSSIASTYTGKALIDECLKQVNAGAEHVRSLSQKLISDGYTGTPTLIFWNPEKGKGLVVPGCLDINACMTQGQLDEVLSWLKS
ncbi:DsbA family protein [Thermofilum pendens]|uniref:Thioredoxin-like fold domain-containing protein n=1 Tax=Thermofilum pendens (strain DSM 2475 / Hrk 5) TaxID=368408 RepID=A1RW56_THEPD|nr:thioredoxin domain-containing protein [Thermofilum pendens]ABL77436.1 hypothetical protein Tpen_0026 [Thermofilum pendens Hrk 5]